MREDLVGELDALVTILKACANSLEGYGLLSVREVAAQLTLCWQRIVLLDLKRLLRSDGLSVPELSDGLCVSPRTVITWRGRGMPCGTIAEAHDWLLQDRQERRDRKAGK